MTEAEKMFVVKAATNKIGATRAHNLLSSMKGGYEYVHGTTDDFKNHQRDANVFIENSELVSMFWADEVAKCNYKEFGDIVSFDATFNSNKYNMKFVPFIGIDNHEKCVTLGSGMLLHEDTKSYTWLLTAFMIAFLKEPTMIVTDQDGAMKRAIKAVFTKAKHRLCMWHIMQTIPSKFVPFIGIDNHGKCVTLGSGMLLHEDTKSYTWLLTAFMTAFLKEPTMIVTDQDGAMKRAIEAVFTKAKHRLCMWHIMQKIPSKFESHSRNLDSSLFSMERQRYRQEALDFKTIEAAPKCETKLPIELHAARVYTRTIFLLVQTEIIQETNPKNNTSLNTKKEKNKRRNMELFAETERENFQKDCTYVEKLKILLDEVKADMPNHTSRNTGDVIGGIFSISKPNQVDVKNPTKAVNKGEHLKNGERLKSEREKVIKVKAKAMKVCGYCQEKKNEHTKITCPKNPKARKKKKLTPIIDV
ncbi:FAR1-related sequence 5-like protein [Tanacetum coccineum]